MVLQLRPDLGDDYSGSDYVILIFDNSIHIGNGSPTMVTIMRSRDARLFACSRIVTVGPASLRSRSFASFQRADTPFEQAPSCAEGSARAPRFSGHRRTSLKFHRASRRRQYVLSPFARTWQPPVPISSPILQLCSLAYFPR